LYQIVYYTTSWVSYGKLGAGLQKGVQRISKFSKSKSILSATERRATSTSIDTPIVSACAPIRRRTKWREWKLSKDPDLWQPKRWILDFVHGRMNASEFQNLLDCDVADSVNESYFELPSVSSD